MRFLAVLLAALFLTAAEPPTEVRQTATFAIVNARIFDGSQVISRGTVVVEGDRIAAVGPEVKPPAGARVIDAAGATLLAPYLQPNEVTNLKNSAKRPGSKRDLKFSVEAVRQLHAAGVPIVAGSDSPNRGTAHGASIHREMEMLVQAGLSPTQALAAATSVAAKAFRLEDRGRIAPGLKADLVLVQGDPTADITATRSLLRIWKAGREVERRKVETPVK